MDEQIARQVFETIVIEVVDYVKNPTSEADLISRVKRKVSFPDLASIRDSNNHNIVRADVSFYIDEEKNKKLMCVLDVVKLRTGLLVRVMLVQAKHCIIAAHIFMNSFLNFGRFGRTIFSSIQNSMTLF